MTQPPMLPALLKRPCPRILPLPAICRKGKSRLRSRKPPPRWRSPLMCPMILLRMGWVLKAMNWFWQPLPSPPRKI